MAVGDGEVILSGCRDGSGFRTLQCDLSKHPRIIFQSPPCNLSVIGIQLDQDAVSLQAIGHEARGAGAPERIKHHAICGAPGFNTRLDQIGREGREMSLSKRSGSYRPDISEICTIALLV